MLDIYLLKNLESAIHYFNVSSSPAVTFWRMTKSLERGQIYKNCQLLRQVIQ